MTHFEQVYERAVASLDNALALFDYANQVKIAQRESQDARRDFVTTIIEKDIALMNELIELFGYPYDADIGVNGTYPEGYDGPDIYNYDLWDRTEMTDFEKRCSEDQIEDDTCEAETTTQIVEFKPMDCLGFFVEEIDEDTVAGESICDETPGTQPEEPETLKIEYRVGTGLDKGRGRFKPDNWPADAARKAPGEIQNAIQALYQARTEYEIAITAYQNHVETMEDMAESIKDRHEVLKAQNRLLEDHQAELDRIDRSILVWKESQIVMETTADIINDFGEAAGTCIPEVFGFSNLLPDTFEKPGFS